MRRFLVVNLALLFLMGWGFTSEMMRNGSMQEEIEQLELQAEALEGRNVELRNLAQKYSGSGMLEREARLKLNLKKPGEEVVVVRDINSPALTTEGESQNIFRELATEEVKPPDQSSNIKKWISYFFPY